MSHDSTLEYDTETLKSTVQLYDFVQFKLK